MFVIIVASGTMITIGILFVNSLVSPHFLSINTQEG